MHTIAPRPLTWRHRLILIGAAVLLLGVLSALVLLMYVAHQQTSGVTPISPPMPVAPAPNAPAPLGTGQAPIIIPDDA
jgi:hypothetical protein